MTITTKTKGAIGLISALVLFACGSTDPEAAGAGDAYRNEAADMPLGDVVTGEIDTEGGDTTDWKSVTLEEGGKVTVQLATDKKDADVTIGVFDKHGVEVASASKKGGSDKSAKVQFKAPSEGGRYFIRIQEKAGSKTTYSVQVSMGDGGGGGGGPDI